MKHHNQNNSILIFLQSVYVEQAVGLLFIWSFYPKLCVFFHSFMHAENISALTFNWHHFRNQIGILVKQLMQSRAFCICVVCALIDKTGEMERDKHTGHYQEVPCTLSYFPKQELDFNTLNRISTSFLCACFLKTLANFDFYIFGVYWEQPVK